MTLINNYLQKCESTTAGNDNRIWVAPYRAISEVTFDTGETITGIVMTGDTLFAELQADWDSVGYERNGQAARSFVSEQTLVASFSNLSSELITLVNQLRNYTVCGLVILRKDGNGKYFISGVSTAATSARNRPYTRIEDTFTTGTNITEVDDANKEVISFMRTAGVEEYELSAALSAEMNAKTADFVNFN